MRKPPFTGDGSYLPLVLTIALAATVLALSWYGYRAAREWRRSTAALTERTAQDGADLLVTALTRDMRGAQALVLANRDSGDYATQHLADFSYEVASAFTRYLYPESVFGWRRADRDLVFFNRASRPPPWMTGANAAGRYPVVVVANPDVARPIRDRIEQFARNRLTYAHFDTRLAGVPYAVVARLRYSDVYREQLDGFTGFTVNLAWVREQYFSELVAEVGRIESRIVLDYAVLDEAGTVVAGMARGNPAAAREFPLQFFDQASTELDGGMSGLKMWSVRVSAARNPMLNWASSGEDTTLLAIAATSLGLAISFLLTAHSVRARASLAAMRAEFVSTVTHELKTPLATIRAVGETLVRGRLTSPNARRIRAAPAAGKQAADPPGGQPARLRPGHRRARGLFVRAARACGAHRGFAARVPLQLAERQFESTSTCRTTCPS